LENSSIADRFHRIMASVSDAAHRAGRSPESVRLVAVTKYATPDRMAEAHAAGIREFGENKVQDAVSKLAALAHLAPRWHFIGHLQTNKVKRVVGAFELIHSVDTWKLAEALSREAVARRLVQPVLIQVDTSGETSKYGMAPEEVPEAIGRIARELPGVEVQGLMTMAPHAAPEEVARSCFRELRELRDACNEGLPGNARMEHLSMGMTQDFTVAIEEGATLIRIGSGLFL
jgi:pyridoxal phosphate enzyme (YggS family)